jgi:hypothetical protein
MCARVGVYVCKIADRRIRSSAISPIGEPSRKYISSDCVSVRQCTGVTAWIVWFSGVDASIEWRPAYISAHA